ncbi:MAG TPA: 1-(5-phosphoribosyl)-5-[(5-phosphoribosylamino)methylideneamino]imidazole-4-carboxamide isomerase [Actinomycetota bacterium]|nr:1-(5-phosphoribosyl)-5-[(5-phosphoribosylamino)methylideneamino]imidazole-4-carboxamide isomerase [Actinomycetota bacterium]
MILLPAIDLRGGRCVRLTQGDFDQETVYDDDPVAVAKRFEAAGAEWLHVVDLDAALEGVPRNRDAIRAVVDAVGLKVEISGGIRDEDAVRAALAAGATRIVIGTRALNDPAFVTRVVAEHGDAIAIGLDVRGTRLQARGWTEDAGELYPTLAALDEAGARTYVVTDVARDGMLSGPNLDLLADVMSRTPAALVASGGVSSLADLRALARLGVPECIVGKALYAGAFTLPEAIKAARA